MLNSLQACSPYDITFRMAVNQIRKGIGKHLGWLEWSTDETV